MVVVAQQVEVVGGLLVVQMAAAEVAAEAVMVAGAAVGVVAYFHDLQGP